MNNPKWNKQAKRNAILREAGDGLPTATAPVTEAELEALRYRGTPIRRPAPPVEGHQTPGLDHGDPRTPASDEK